VVGAAGAYAIRHTRNPARRPTFIVMTAPFHPGELAVQARAGVTAAARRVGGIIQSSIPAPASAFLVRQQLAILGSADADGLVWASLLTGGPGVFRAVDPHTLWINAAPAAGDPLGGTLARGAPFEAGVLVIDLGTRRRLRLNGVAAAATDGGVTVRVREVYGNCPKYIQRRVLDSRAGDPPAPNAGTPERGARLTDAQRAWIACADTCFLASLALGRGADASHRGGEPGFVRLAREPSGEEVLLLPDYSGNDMFNTFGNLAVHPAAGLLFVDFARGAALQITGTAEVLWDRAHFAAFPGAERALRFRVAGVVELRDATPLRWRLVERSPFNPPAPTTPACAAPAPTSA
jgi:predicted pyridoxine 5'-phosphate oxidase superfamily flavin-nucleotide-binding protein